MLTIKQTAEKLGVHWQTVRNYIDREELKAYKIGKLVKIKEEDLDDFINNYKEHDKDDVELEIELRYEVTNRKVLEKKLIELGGKVSYHGHIIDHWFIPNRIKNRQQHDDWFDVKRGCGIRIREQDNGYTGKIATSMETKRLTKEMNHNTFLEAELSIDNYKKGKVFLEMMDRKEFLTIDKDRVIYTLEDFKICIDEIKGYGCGVEIELSGNYNREEALKRIAKMSKKLDLVDSDKADKSVTVNAMVKLAKF